jgi:hypothetical protein
MVVVLSKYHILLLIIVTKQENTFYCNLYVSCQQIPLKKHHSFYVYSSLTTLNNMYIDRSKTQWHNQQVFKA